jgi:serine/threonine-protein kinase
MTNADPDAPPHLVGTRYELLRLLGSGGMADVHLALDRHLDREVAIKLLARSLAADPVVVERFRREARAAAALNHPNVVKVYDWGEADGTHFLVMEYVRGATLREVLRERGRLPEAEALGIAAQVAEALQAAHEQGLVHRDVKPDNVLLDEDGRARVADFGIARAFGAAHLTTDNVVLGSAHYLAPEQVQGRPVDHRADLYSLAAVLYELLTGRPPVQGDSAVAVALQHVVAPPPPPRSLRPDLSPLSEAVVLQGLAKDPADRYASAQAMRVDLERAVRGDPQPASHPTPPAVAPPIPTAAAHPRRRLTIRVPRISIRRPSGMVLAPIIVLPLLVAGGIWAETQAPDGAPSWRPVASPTSVAAGGRAEIVKRALTQAGPAPTATALPTAVASPTPIPQPTLADVQDEAPVAVEEQGGAPAIARQPVEPPLPVTVPVVAAPPAPAAAPPVSAPAPAPPPQDPPAQAAPMPTARAAKPNRIRQTAPKQIAPKKQAKRPGRRAGQ